MRDGDDDDRARLGAIDEVEGEAFLDSIETVFVVNANAKLGIAAEFVDRRVDDGFKPICSLFALLEIPGVALVIVVTGTWQ